MEKRYANFAFFYAIIAMIFGVFYREFTKLNHFTGHTHYFLLGMFFFLILILVEKLFAFSDKTIKKFILVYQIRLNITGIAGIGHSLMGISFIFILRKIKKSID